MKLNQAVMFLSCIVLLVIMSGCNSDDKLPEQGNLPPEIKAVSITETWIETDFTNGIDIIKQDKWILEALDHDGNIIKYDWELLSDQPFQVNGTDTKQITFQYPFVNSEEPNIVIFDVTVTDNQDSQTSYTFEKDLNDYLFILIFDIEVVSGEYSTLKANILGRESKIGTLLWSVDSEHDLTLFDINTSNVSFVAPDVTEVTEITLRLDITTSESDPFNPDGVNFTHIAKVKIYPR